MVGLWMVNGWLMDGQWLVVGSGMINGGEYSHLDAPTGRMMVRMAMMETW